MYTRRTHSKVATLIDAAASRSRYSLVVGLSQVGGDGNHSRLSTRNSNGGPNGIRTRVFSPPRAFVMVEQRYVKLTKRCNLGELNSLVI